jgi:hypothetical protein
MTTKLHALLRRRGAASATKLPVRYGSLELGPEAVYAHHTIVGLSVGDDVIHYRDITNVIIAPRFLGKRLRIETNQRAFVFIVQWPVQPDEFMKELNARGGSTQASFP